MAGQGHQVPAQEITGALVPGLTRRSLLENGIARERVTSSANAPVRAPERAAGASVTQRAHRVSEWRLPTWSCCPSGVRYPTSTSSQNPIQWSTFFIPARGFS